MKRDVFPSTPSALPQRRTRIATWAATFAGLALVLGLSTPPASASPPTPREVAKHVHKRVSGIFYKVARVLEGAPSDEEKAAERREREREARYLNDRYDDRSTGIRNPELEPYTPPPPGYRDQDRDREPRYLPPHTSDDEWRRREAQRKAQLQQEERNFERQQRSEGRTEYYTPDLANPEEPLDRRRSSNPESPGLNLRQRGGESHSSTDANVPPPPNTSAAVSKRSANSDNNSTRSGSTAEPRKGTESSSTTKPDNQSKASYATPVPNKEGFVYPPGVKQETANMLDVRGLSTGQKARDPRTGNVFLVP